MAPRSSPRWLASRRCCSERRLSGSVLSPRIYRELAGPVGCPPACSPIVDRQATWLVLSDGAREGRPTTLPRTTAPARRCNNFPMDSDVRCPTLLSSVRHVHDCLFPRLLSLRHSARLTNVSFVWARRRAWSSSARTASASQRCLAPRSGPTPAGLGTITGPALSATQLIPPIHRPAAHMVNTRSPSGVSPSTREGQGVPHRRTAHRAATSNPRSWRQRLPRRHLARTPLRATKRSTTAS